MGVLVLLTKTPRIHAPSYLSIKFGLTRDSTFALVCSYHFSLKIVRYSIKQYKFKQDLS